MILTCEGLTLSYGENTVLDGVSFSVNEGDRLGIVGVNGAGKTTLLNIITGRHEADAGLVSIPGGVTVGMLEQNPVSHGTGTVYEVMLSAHSALLAKESELAAVTAAAEAGDTAASARVSALAESFAAAGGATFRSRTRSMLLRLAFTEEDFNKPASVLSGGQKTRLALGRLLLSDPDILLLDEPTNHLDIETLYWLESYLTARRGTLLVVSHDRYFLDRVTTKTLHLERGHSKLYPVAYTEYVRRRAEDRAVQAHQYESQQREIHRIEAYIEQQRRWNRERNIIAAESREKQLAKLVRVERPEEELSAMKLRFNFCGESGQDVLTLRGLTKGYGSRTLFSGENLLVKKGQRVFVCGPNGCGKSTLLRIIARQISADSGTARLGDSVVYGYYDQENQRLCDEKTVLDDLWDAYPSLPQVTIRSTLALFLFRGEDVGRLVGSLSGGERARLTLCRLVLSPCNLLLLDEPTNHLDIPSREVLEAAVAAFPGTVISVSHDRYFMQRLGDRFLTFRDGVIEDYEGTFDELRARETAAEAASSAQERQQEEPMTAAKSYYIETKRAAAEARRAETRLRRAREEATALETRLGEIDRLLESDAASDYTVVAPLLEEKEAAEERLLELYGEIEELQSKQNMQ